MNVISSQGLFVKTFESIFKSLCRSHIQYSLPATSALSLNSQRNIIVIRTDIKQGIVTEKLGQQYNTQS